MQITAILKMKKIWSKFLKCKLVSKYFYLSKIFSISYLKTDRKW